MGCVDVFGDAALTQLTTPVLGVLRGTWAFICSLDTPHSHLSYFKKWINTTVLVLEFSFFYGLLVEILYSFLILSGPPEYKLRFGVICVFNNQSKAPHLRSEEMLNRTGMESGPKPDTLGGKKERKNEQMDK